MSSYGITTNEAIEALNAFRATLYADDIPVGTIMTPISEHDEQRCSDVKPVCSEPIDALNDLPIWGLFVEV